MFTDRFIKIPIKVFDRQQKELTGRAENKESYMMINPFDIMKYRPSEDEDSDEEIVSITDKSGATTWVYLTIKEFETLLNNHNA